MSEKIPQGNQGAVPEEGGIWDGEKAEAVGKATYTVASGLKHNPFDVIGKPRPKYFSETDYHKYIEEELYKVEAIEAPLATLYDLNPEYFARIGTKEFIAIAEEYAKLNQEILRRESVTEPVRAGIEYIERILAQSTRPPEKSHWYNPETLQHKTVAGMNVIHTHLYNFCLTPDYFEKHPDYPVKLGFVQRRSGKWLPTDINFGLERSYLNYDETWKMLHNDFDSSIRQKFEKCLELLYLNLQATDEYIAEAQTAFQKFLQQHGISAEHKKKE
jgi:hypothetical protein